MSRVPKTCPPGFKGRYTVVKGDTMWLIAQRFGVTLNALIQANPHISDPSQIFPGDVLCVPNGENGRIPEECPPGFKGRYTVVKGDTMWLIAQRFGVTLNALIQANPHISDPTQIFPGDVLCVPNGENGRIPEECPPGFKGRYTVVKGDTMWLIAQRISVSIDALIQANPHITDPSQIFPGDVLCVPNEENGRIPEECPPGFKGRYTVVKGDTIYSIAKAFSVSVGDLINANPHIPNPDEIFPGDVLCVPNEENGRVPEECPPSFQGRYTVVKGDTIYSIAKAFSVSVGALVKANPHIPNPDEIFPGDVLCVPNKAKLDSW